MKREILCPKCHDKTAPVLGSYAGEHVKWLEGDSKGGIVCDQCVTPLPAGEPCWALSIWADYGGIPYFPWEQDYLRLTDKENADAP